MSADLAGTEWEADPGALALYVWTSLWPCLVGTPLPCAHRPTPKWALVPVSQLEPKGSQPRLSALLAHWGLPCAFLRQGKSNQRQEVTLLPHLALLGERLLERLVLHNEL